MAKRIGLMIGDFDPVFSEQIEMCEEIIDEFGLDYVLLAPFIIPRQTVAQMTTYIDSRKDMIKLAVWRKQNIRLMDDFEVKDTSIPAQLDVIRKLEAKYNAEIFYITTSNYYLAMQNQEGFDEFVRDRTLIVAVRPHFSQTQNELGALNARCNTKVYFASTTKTLLSSTIIRAYIQMGVINEGLLPYNVIEYINKNILYKMHSRLFEKVWVLEPPPIYTHTVETCLNALEIARAMHLNQNNALLAALLHNIGKCFTISDLENAGVYVSDLCKNSDLLSMHGRRGELAAKYFMGIEDKDILDAIRHHSTAKANMTPFELMLFCACNLAAYHNTENYENLKYSFFENPREVFFDILDKKFHRAKKELPLTDFPKSLKEAHRYYTSKKNLATTFQSFTPNGTDM